jgi:hypothetical protein
VGQLQVFGPGLFVEDFCVQLLYLQLGIMLELLNHIAIHLDVVTFAFDFADFVFEQFEVVVEFGRCHLHEDVVGLLLLLWFFWWHASKEVVLLVIFNLYII